MEGDPVNVDEMQRAGNGSHMRLVLLRDWQSSLDNVAPVRAWLGCYHALLVCCNVLGLSLAGMLVNPQRHPDGTLDLNLPGRTHLMLLRQYFINTITCEYYTIASGLSVDYLWRQFIGDIRKATMGILAAFQGGNCTDLFDVHKIYCQIRLRPQLVELIVKAAKGNAKPYSHMQLPVSYELLLNRATGETSAQIVPGIRLNENTDWLAVAMKSLSVVNENRQRVRDRKKEIGKDQVTSKVRMEVETVQQPTDATEEERAVARSPRLKALKRKAIDMEMKRHEKRKKKKGGKRKDEKKEEDGDGNDDDDGGGKPVAVDRWDSDWRLAVEGEFPQMYLEVQTPLTIDGVTDGAACGRMHKADNYPDGIEGTVFYEFANQQMAFNRNLHKRLHGARTRKEYESCVEKAVANDVAVTTIPVSTRGETKTAELFLLSGNRVGERFQRMFPEQDLIGIASRCADHMLATAKLDSLRAIPNMHLGWQTQNFEDTADLEEVGENQLFSRPKLHDTAKLIPDDELRYSLGCVGEFLQEELKKAHPEDDDLLSDAPRAAEFADEFSLSLTGRPGLCWEAGQTNLGLMGHPLGEEGTGKGVRKRGPKNTRRSGGEGAGSKVQAKVGGVDFHIDKNNCDKPGYDYLGSASVMLYNKRTTQCFRWWMGYYYRKIVSNYMERNGNYMQVCQRVNEFLANEQLAGIDNMAWASVCAAGTQDTISGLQFAQKEGGSSRLPYLDVFVSPIKQLREKFQLTLEEVLQMVRLALLLQGNVSFYVIAMEWLERDESPFAGPLTLVEKFREDCLANPEIGGPMNCPSKSQRYSPFSGTFWSDLDKEPTTRKRAIQRVWTAGNETMVAFHKELLKLQNSRKKLPSHDELSVACAFTLSNARECKPKKHAFTFKKYARRDFKVIYCGKFTAFLALPMMVLLGLVDESFIPAADYTGINYGATYQTKLAEMGFRTNVQLEALVKYLSETLGISIGVVENVLCKVYREQDVYDFRFLGMTVSDFVEGHLVTRVVE